MGSTRVVPTYSQRSSPGKRCTTCTYRTYSGCRSSPACRRRRTPRTGSHPSGSRSRPSWASCHPKHTRTRAGIGRPRSLGSSECCSAGGRARGEQLFFRVVEGEASRHASHSRARLKFGANTARVVNVGVGTGPGWAYRCVSPRVQEPFDHVASRRVHRRGRADTHRWLRWLARVGAGGKTWRHGYHWLLEAGEPDLRL